MRNSTIAWVACVGTVLCGGAFAGDKTDQDMKDAAAVTSSADFVKKAGQANMAEIQTSQLALTKTQNPDVRKFADRMVKDHGKAGNELATLAKQKDLEVPREVDPQHKAAMEQLRSKSGTEFDAAYMRQMAKDHDKAVALFENASTASGVDKELQAFAKKTLPTLEQHDHMANDVIKQASIDTHSSQR